MLVKRDVWLTAIRKLVSGLSVTCAATMLFLLAVCLDSSAKVGGETGAWQGSDRVGHGDKKALVVSGVPWYDDEGHVVNAHGACIVKEAGRYYLFGEWKSDTTNAFPGFACYSSDNLADWHFERVVLPQQAGGLMGPGRVGERVKVMRCPATGEYVMFMHSDDMQYKDPHTCYATCETINGEYTFRGPLLYQGQPIRRWDIGTFQDSDGKGYLLVHHGMIYELSADYHTAARLLPKIEGMGESPAMMKKNGVYFLLTSNLTSWEKNDNFYFTAPSMDGPWTRRGFFCPEGTLTYNSQSTFVLPLVHNGDTIPVYMGDRWSYPHQASSATYVWQPMQVDGTKLVIPAYVQAWDANRLREADPLRGFKSVKLSDIQRSRGWTYADGLLRSNEKGAVLTVPFEGVQVAVLGNLSPHGGYARMAIVDGQGKEVSALLIDFYGLKPEQAVRYISPRLPEGRYSLTIYVTGDHAAWSDKRKNRYGSDDNEIAVSGVRVLK